MSQLSEQVGFTSSASSYDVEPFQSLYSYYELIVAHVNKPGMNESQVQNMCFYTYVFYNIVI